MLWWKCSVSHLFSARFSAGQLQCIRRWLSPQTCPAASSWGRFNLLVLLSDLQDWSLILMSWYVNYARPTRLLPFAAMLTLEWMQPQSCIRTLSGRIRVGPARTSFYLNSAHHYLKMTWFHFRWNHFCLHSFDLHDQISPAPQDNTLTQFNQIFIQNSLLKGCFHLVCWNVS